MALLVAERANGIEDLNWESMGALPGISDTIYAMVEGPDGELYLAGRFSWIGDASHGWVAKWDGSSWSQLGSGSITNPYHDVSALAIHEERLYAAGRFRQTSGEELQGVVCWSGSEWTLVGATRNVFTLASHDGKLYAGGSFTEVSSVPVNNIAAYDGTSWEPLGEGMDSNVGALISHDGKLYAGGRFNTAGGVPAHRLAQWNGGEWAPLASDLAPANAVVETLGVHDGKLIVGGNFTSAGGTSTNGVAAWTGSAWETFGDGPGNTVHSVAEWEGKLVAGGSFPSAQGGNSDPVSIWNGTSWEPIARGFGTTSNASVFSVIAHGELLWAGGDFRQEESSGANGLMVHDGSEWMPIPAGSATTYVPNGKVSAIAEHGDDILVAGEFTHVGGVRTGQIARWDGETWHAMGSELDGSVHVIHVADDRIYLGGRFTMAGTTEVKSVACWNGEDWVQVGEGIGPNGLMSFAWVNALAMHDGKLYAGGSLGQSGEVTLRNAAVWDGASWQSMEGGLDKTVHDIAVFNGEVYFGGEFDFAYPDAGGRFGVYRFAKWTEAGWARSLHPGRVGPIFDMEVHGGALYVGGEYFLPLQNGGPRSNVMKWDGMEFSLVGEGFQPHIRSLESVDGGLLAGATGGPLQYWNGDAWSEFAPANGSIDTIHNGTDGLWVGGEFFEIGGIVSPYLAVARPGAPRLSGIRLDENGAEVFFNVPPGSYRFERSLNGLTNWELLETVSTGGNGGVLYVDADAVNHRSAYYRAVPVIAP